MDIINQKPAQYENDMQQKLSQLKIPQLNSTIEKNQYRFIIIEVGYMFSLPTDFILSLKRKFNDEYNLEHKEDDFIESDQQLTNLSLKPKNNSPSTSPSIIKRKLKSASPSIKHRIGKSIHKRSDSNGGDDDNNNNVFLTSSGKQRLAAAPQNFTNVSFYIL